jgi:hypothetical protein
MVEAGRVPHHHFVRSYHMAHAVTACARVFSSRTVRTSCAGWHGIVSGKVGEPGAHGHDGHDLYCMLHHINRKDQKRGGSIEPPAN